MSFPAILALEDGSIFHGEAFGIEKKAVGELVFNTSMSGYQEIMTDPSYNRQIITFTHPILEILELTRKIMNHQQFLQKVL